MNPCVKHNDIILRQKSPYDNENRWLCAFELICPVSALLHLIQAFIPIIGKDMSCIRMVSVIIEASPFL